MTLARLLSENDGSGRILREVQIAALTEIHRKWNPNRHFVLKAPVASGKSLILKAAQSYWSGSIVNPTNQLVGQYTASYPDLNYLIGSQLYKCSEYLTSCAIGSNRFNCKGAVDVGCCLVNARDRFASGEGTVLNIMSAFVNRARMKVAPGINYVDEAHGLCSSIRSLASTTVKFGSTERAIMRKLGYEKKDLTSELKLCAFLAAKVDKYQILMKKAKDADDAQKHYEVIENTQFVLEAISKHPEIYVIEFESEVLRILPVFAPRSVLDRILGKTGIVASGTMLPETLKELLGPQPFESYECESPIPANRRQVIHEPVDCKFDYASIRPDLIADKIREIYLRKGKAPLFVHATYSMASRLQPFLSGPDVLYHAKETKIDAIDEFKRNGGIFIGSGLAAGLDLAGSQFQAQIITQLMFPSLGDLYVKKRKMLEGGDRWYTEECATTFLQAIGRTTRDPTDYSETFCLDPRLPQVYNGWKRSGLISKDVNDSMVWRK